MNIKDRLRLKDQIDAENARRIKEFNNRNKIVGVFVDTESGTALVKEIDKNLQAYYDLLNCQYIDIVSRRIMGKRFLIVCDDEALIRSTNPIPTAIGTYGELLLYGNLFVVADNGVDDVRSLTPDEARHVLSATQRVMYTRHGEAKNYRALVGCDW